MASVRTVGVLGVFRVVCSVHGAGGCTRTWAPGIGGAQRDAQAAVDVGATTFGIARWQDRGLGDSTVARAGFHSSITRTYTTPYGVACANRISGPGRARARPWLEGSYSESVARRQSPFRSHLLPADLNLIFAVYRRTIFCHWAEPSHLFLNR
jgi:hypothetical protein